MIRRFQDADEPELRRLFKLQAFEYDFPELNKMLDIHVLRDEGRVVQAVGAMPTADIYLLADPDWQTPGIRKEGIAMLHNTMEASLSKLGIVQVHSWLPPQVERPFGRRLMRDFRWTKPEWTCFARKVGI